MELTRLKPFRTSLVFYLGIGWADWRCLNLLGWRRCYSFFSSFIFCLYRFVIHELKFSFIFLQPIFSSLYLPYSWIPLVFDPSAFAFLRLNGITVVKQHSYKTRMINSQLNLVSVGTVTWSRGSRNGCWLSGRCRYKNSSKSPFNVV